MTPNRRLASKLAAEFVGTFALVFAGCGAAAVNFTTGGALGVVGIALVFGLVILAMVLACGHLSGAHFNPAVTLAFAVSKRFPWKQVVPYWLTQLAAAILAAGLLRLAFGHNAILAAGVGFEIGPGVALMLEGVLTFFLMFVIASVATDSRAVGEMAGVAIGATVALGALFGGPITGAAMNPARALGPALAGENTAQLWLYFVGPCLGAAFGALAYELIRCDAGDEPPKDAQGCC